VDNRNVADPGEPEYDTSANVQPLIDHENEFFDINMSHTNN
jgi:phosphopantetheinyl transferase